MLCYEAPRAFSSVAMLVGSTNLGEQSLIMKGTPVSCSSQLYSEHQTIYAWRVKKSHWSKVYKHKDKPHMAK